MSSTFEKEFGKGKSKITVPFKAWQVKTDSIRKLNRAKKEQMPDKAREFFSSACPVRCS